MSLLKKGLLLGAVVVGIFALSVGYHHHMIRKAVVEDINSESFLQSDESDDKEEKDSTVNNIIVSKEEIENHKTEDKEIREQKTEELDKNQQQEETKMEVISGSYKNLSNETCAWGFVRKSNGQQPEFYGPHAKVLDAYQGIYCGNNNENVLYLTFDEGYENGYTASILDTLKEKEVTAAFFVTMPYVKQNPDLVKRMIAEGHIVGNHTVNHPSMPSVTDDEKLAKEVMDLHQYVSDHFQYEMSYLRPPKGEYSERTVKLCLDLGYRHVLWSSAYADWDPNNQKGSDNAKKMIYNNFHNGSVMLLHAVSKDNATVLGDVIDEARSRGFEFLSLDDFEY